MEWTLDSPYNRYVVQIYSVCLYQQEEAKRCHRCLDAEMDSCLWNNGINNDRQRWEFSSDEMREVASILNVRLITTAADSPFQNGLCEHVH